MKENYSTLAALGKILPAFLPFPCPIWPSPSHIYSTHVVKNAALHASSTEDADSEMDSNNGQNTNKMSFQDFVHFMEASPGVADYQIFISFSFSLNMSISPPSLQHPYWLLIYHQKLSLHSKDNLRSVTYRLKRYRIKYSYNLVRLASAIYQNEDKVQEQRFYLEKGYQPYNEDDDLYKIKISLPFQISLTTLDTDKPFQKQNWRGFL